MVCLPLRDTRRAAGVKNLMLAAMARISSRSESAEPPPPDFEGGAAVAVTVTDCTAEPPGPVHVSVRVAVAVMTTARVPLVGWLPVQTEAPPAMQAVAFWLLQVSCTVCPAATDELAAVKLTVGAVELTLTEYKPYPTGSGEATNVSTY